MRLRALARAALACAALACGVSSGETYRDVSGVVQSVDAEQLQVRIAHDEIPGFMPAMTMSFDVERAELLEGLEPGQRVRFDLERSATRLRIRSLEISRGSGAVGRSGSQPLDIRRPAPDFELVDHDGRPFALSTLRGRAVLVDFVFTRCPGPCPILTSSHVTLQRMLPPELAGRTQFVSISLDPEWDTPERLREYAEARGADLAHWRFLTGETERVQGVLRDYHVGSVRQPDGNLDHLVVTYLIGPDGHIAEYYVGLEHDPRKLLADLERSLP